MEPKRLTRIVCAAEPRGSVQAVEQLLEIAPELDVQAIALAGDLSDGENKAESYRELFKALGEGDLPTFWVPGPSDAPIETYLREAQNIEVVFPFLHGIHGTLAFAPGYVMFTGLGGEILDDPSAPREEEDGLRYPRWEAEYRLKVVPELAEHESIWVLWTQPAHKGLGKSGSEVVAELINTHRPRLVVTAGHRGTVTLGRSLVVTPGSLTDGDYAVTDLRAGEVEFHQLADAAVAG
jgi:uncharacterized protein